MQPGRPWDTSIAKSSAVHSMGVVKLNQSGNSTIMKKVCILTTAHMPTDVRIYHHEAVSLARVGYRVTIIAPWHRSELASEGIQIIAVKKPSTRLGRFTQTAARIFKTAMSQRADIYHFHDPDLLPWMMLFSAMGKRVIYDVHEYNSKAS